MFLCRLTKQYHRAIFRSKEPHMSLNSFDDRNYGFSSIYNFRDFGGYTGRDGRAVKTGRLFRSAHLSALTEEDREAIGALDVNLVVDLRYAPERKRQPSRFPTPMPHLLEFPDVKSVETVKVAPHEAFLENELHTPEDAHGYMMRSYSARPHHEGFQSIFADTLRFLAKAPDDKAAGIIVHCAAGKDRTGTLCALIHSVLGVSRDDIMADYMMTLEAVDIDKIIEPAAAAFSKRFNRKIDSEALRPMFGVVPEFLEAALDGMTDSSGSTSSYVSDTLRIEPEVIARIEDLYLTD